MDNIKWFKEAKFGMMAHWGLYSLLMGEYRGKRVNDYAEWAQSFFSIPNAEYELLAKSFNPIYFSADEWINLAKDSGMNYFVFVSKHHDGFAMYHSKVDKYNIVDATPFGRDVTAELAEACYKHGLKFGLYYSQELDWHHPHGGGYDQFEACSGVSWDNSWDYPDRTKKNFSICFEEKIKPQVEELLKSVNKTITVAVMGCVVNGPGEARHADVGIAGGKGEGLIFRKGEILYKMHQEQLVDALMAEIDKL